MKSLARGARIGFLVPGRPATPSDGRAQHYMRPGDPAKQETRKFTNGTSLTFGIEDPIDVFHPCDPFYEQILVIESAISDIQAVRQRYRGVNIESTFVEGQRGGTSTNFFQDRSGRLVDRDTAKPLSILNVLMSKTGTTASIYQSTNRSNSPGMAHPGYSTDSRGPVGRAGIHHSASDSKLVATTLTPGNLDKLDREVRSRSRASLRRLLEHDQTRLLSDSTPWMPRDIEQHSSKNSLYIKGPKMNEAFVASKGCGGENERDSSQFQMNLSPSTSHSDFLDACRQPESFYGTGDKPTDDGLREVSVFNPPAGIGLGHALGKHNCGSYHARQLSEQTSVFFKDDFKQKSPVTDGNVYIGYSIHRGGQNELSRPSTLTPSKRSAQYGANRETEHFGGAPLDPDSCQSSPGPAYPGSRPYCDRNAARTQDEYSLIRPASAGFFIY